MREVHEANRERCNGLQTKDVTLFPIRSRVFFNGQFMYLLVFFGNVASIRSDGFGNVDFTIEACPACASLLKQDLLGLLALLWERIHSLECPPCRRRR